jgi:hypothetical protein
LAWEFRRIAGGSEAHHGSRSLAQTLRAGGGWNGARSAGWFTGVENDGSPAMPEEFQHDGGGAMPPTGDLIGLPVSQALQDVGGERQVGGLGSGPTFSEWSGSIG